MAKQVSMKLVGLGIGAMMLLILLTNMVVIVDAGFVGVVTHFGAVQEEVLPEGMHFVVPVQTKVEPINVRVQKIEADAKASSKDLQNVTSKVALNYYLDKGKANTIFQELGVNYKSTIISPTIQESIKSVTAKYTAEELITKRPLVKKDVFEDIKVRLGENNIIVSDFSIVDFNFSSEFNRAIEAKQIAEQRALTARNDLDRIKTEAEQVTAKAIGEADAELAKAKAQAEAQKLLSQTLTKDILQLKTIEKWDGKTPIAIGEGSTSFLDIAAAAKKK